jgi:aminoglycoside phosphotransferase (APT) family kinase protein
VRIGDTVRRPTSRHTSAIARLLTHLEAVGFDRVPRFLGIDERDREVLSYIPGDVPLPPFPAWSMTDDVLHQVASLLRDFHDATAAFDWAGEEWSDELADRKGEEVLCHNDVCPENVVFQDGRPRAILDFDFAAPGRRAWDVAFAAGMWAPLGDPEINRSHPPALDGVTRVASFARTYGIEDGEAFATVVDQTRAAGRRFIQRRLDAEETAFVDMVESHGGADRYRRNQLWWEAHRTAVVREIDR